LQQAAVRYKLIKKVKDDKFDEENLHQCSLLLQLGARDFQTAIIDSTTNKIVFFEDYVLGDLRSTDEVFELLKDLFESHELLSAGFWKDVRFSMKNNKFVQVPQALFQEGEEEEYLQFNAKVLPEKEEFLSCRSGKSDVVTAFAIHRELYHWLKKIYANTTVHFLHQSAALIEGVLQAGPYPGSPLFIYVDRFKLHIISIKDQKLVYYNQFAIQQFSDYVKYIMLVLKTLHMDQQTSQIVLWGYIGKNSPHYQEFSKYIRNVTFGQRPKHLKFGYLFDEIQDHHFFDLYATNLVQPQAVTK